MGSEFHRDLIKDGLSPGKADDLVKRSYNRIVEAPAAVLLCCDFSEMDSYPDEKRQQAERLMAVQSTAMSGFLLLLAAHAEGLGGVWVCGPLFAPQAAASALDLPDKWIPQGLLLLGYPAVTPEPRARLPLEAVARFM
jgi:coenzyme F420-0:L-glutamate ligase / coenzyme F420-1:gamma-L-glutamate ligase